MSRIRTIIACSAVAVAFLHVRAQTIDTTPGPTSVNATTKADSGSTGPAVETIGDSAAAPAKSPAVVGEPSSVARPVQRANGPGIPPGALLHATEARRTAITGTVVFLLGLGLDYGVSLPTALAAVANDQVGLAFVSLAVGAASVGLRVGGATAACVGGSRSYDARHSVSVATGSAPPQWYLYNVGWFCTAVSTLLNAVAMINPETPSGLSGLSTVLTIARDGLWTSACIVSLVYSGNTVRSIQEPRVSLRPLGDPVKRSVGLALDARF
jgi:hypothetical protein